ncbi:MAG: class I SAM-dependent methyltransferase [Myxococcales bacterium]|nr:class I SAM-dependent methyltransferase [Myxococcales bacterium]
MKTTSPQTIVSTVYGIWGSSILAAAVENGVFSLLDAGHATAEAVAEAGGLSLRGTQALLDGLAGIGLVERDGGNYKNSEESSTYLVKGKPAYLGDLATRIVSEFSSWSQLPEVVKSGAPAAAHMDLDEDPYWESVVMAIAPLAIPAAHFAAQRLELATMGPIKYLDIGGGSGVWSVVWLELNLDAKGVQIDWANVNKLARDYVALHGFGDRFETIDGNFHTLDFGTEEYDVILYSHCAQAATPEQNIAVFKKVRQALKPGGVLVVNDCILNNDRSGHNFALTFNVNLLLHSSAGSTWTKKQLREWLDAADFHDVTFEQTPTAAALLFARVAPPEIVAADE